MLYAYIRPNKFRAPRNPEYVVYDIMGRYPTLMSAPITPTRSMSCQVMLCWLTRPNLVRGERNHKSDLRNNDVSTYLEQGQSDVFSDVYIDNQLSIMLVDLQSLKLTIAWESEFMAKFYTELHIFKLIFVLIFETHTLPERLVSLSQLSFSVMFM